MKFKFSGFVLLIIFWQGVKLTGQPTHYDFDSLLQSDLNFEVLARQVLDTFEIFGPEEPLEFTVSTDFRNLWKNKQQDEYQEARVIYELWDSIHVSRKIRIKPRGDLRLKICSQPPLRVNVKKTKKVFKLLDDVEKLKLVVPCKEQNTYQNYIYSEFLAYRLLNVITENSFKVRLIKVNYYDTGGKVKQGNTYTFIIESHESLAKRQESLPIKSKQLNAEYIDERSAAILYVFQYMIGNTDWSVPGLHNMKLIKTRDAARPKPIAVPYDFDYAGLVNASYAVPGEHVDITSVTERAYLGHCLPDKLLQEAFESFIQNEPEIMAMVRNFDLMNDNLKKRKLNYLQQFYDIIKDPKVRKHRITRKCKT